MLRHYPNTFHENIQASNTTRRETENEQTSEKITTLYFRRLETSCTKESNNMGSHINEYFHPAHSCCHSAWANATAIMCDNVALLRPLNIKYHR
jgi:hypothetical protein